MNIEKHPYHAWGEYTSILTPILITTFFLTAALFIISYESQESDADTATFYGVNYDNNTITGCDPEIEGDLELVNAWTYRFVFSEYRYEVTSIANNAFNGCSKITSVKIPNYLSNIGYNAFYGCTSLAEFKIGGNTNFMVVDGVLFSSDGKTLIAYPNAKGGSYTVPSTVTTIGKTAFGGCTNLRSITIPDSVSHIEDGAFNGCTNLRSITIPDSVSHIGKKAFEGCESLKTIRLPSSVTSMENAFENSGFTSVTFDESISVITYRAFYGWDKLTTISLPGTIVSIGKEAFYGCKNLESATLPDSIRIIDEKAFGECSSLRSISIPPSVSSIGSNAFSGCTELKSATLPDSVSDIGSGAFENCAKLESIIIPDSISNIKEKTFSKCEELKKVEIGNNVSSISANAFEGCSKLETAIMPASVQTIGDYAFKECTSLESVTIGISVKSIGKHAFNGCASLTAVAIPNSTETIGDYAFNGCSSLESVTIGNSAKSIGDCAFNGCSSLKSIALPDSITSVGQSVFKDCTNLSSATVGDSLNYIGTEMFKGCQKLSTIEFGNSISSIRNEAFYGCSSLKSISIPDSVTSIGREAFNGCKGLSTIVYAPINNFSIGVETFNNMGPLIEVYTNEKLIESRFLDKYVPNNTTVLYESASFNVGEFTYKITNHAAKMAEVLGFSGEQSKKLTIPSSIAYKNVSYKVSSIGANAFEKTAVESVTIPDSVTRIGKSAFSECTKLTNVEMSNSATYIGSYAFNNCSALSAIDLPDTVTYIGPYAFYNCASLSTINISDLVSSIGNYTFYGCKNLTSVIIGKSVKSIGENAFYNCSNLSNVIIPDSVETIERYAFYNISKSLTVETSGRIASENLLKNKTYNTNVTYIVKMFDADGLTFDITDSEAHKVLVSGFSGIPKENLTIPKTISFGGIEYTVTGISTKAFLNDQTIKTVTIPKGVTIGLKSFAKCASLETASISASIIGSNAFFGCDSLTTISFGNVSSIGKNAFDIQFVGTDGKELSTKAMSGKTFIASEGAFRIALSVGEKFVQNGIEYTVESLNPTTAKISGFENGITTATIRDSVVNNHITYAVSTMTDKAFYGCKTLKSIDVSGIPIGSKAFAQCAYLTKATISTDIIGDYAFYGCISLKTLDLTSVKSIGAYAFGKCTSLNTIIFGDNLESVNKNAFYGATFKGYGGSTLSITADSIKGKTFTGTNGTLNIMRPGTGDELIVDGIKYKVLTTDPNTVSVSGYKGKITSVSLKSEITFDGLEYSVVEIAAKAFYGCSSLKTVNIEGIDLIGTKAFGGCSALTTATLDSKEIGSFAFYGCEKLAAIDLTSTGTIGAYAFGKCTGLKSVAFGDELQSIGNNAFPYKFLKSSKSYLSAEKDLRGQNFVKSASGFLLNYAIGNKFTENGLTYKVTSVIPNRVAIVGYEGGVENLIVPESVSYKNALFSITAIGSKAFYGCESLRTVDIGAVTTISAKAFATCSALNDVNLDSAKTIEDYAFFGCNKLSTVTFGDSLSSIEAKAFGSVKFFGLNGDEIEQTAANLAGKTFTKSSGAFKAKSFFVDGIEYSIKSGTQAVTVSGYKGNPESISIPASVTADGYTFDVSAIDSKAFYRCDTLTAADLGSAEIGMKAFARCSSLKTVVTDAETIGYGAFWGCLSLESASIQGSAKTIGYGAFRGCSSLETVALGKSVETVGDYAFCGCFSLRTVTIPNSVVSIGDNAFWGCTSLESVALGKSVETIGDFAFHLCTSLKSITLPDSIESLGEYAFSWCTSLETANTGSISTIGDGAFWGCSSLKTISFGDSLQDVSSSAFRGLTFAENDGKTMIASASNLAGKTFEKSGGSLRLAA